MKEVITAWQSKAAFEAMVDPEKIGDDHHSLAWITRQRERLVLADVLVLQEMDIGVKRSGYVDAAGELAKALQMNYAYTAQYLEIDPAVLGLEKIMFKDGGEDQEAMDYYHVDPAKYKGVFGSAVLSRYPIKHVEVRPLKTQPYDWYWGEKPKAGFLEKTRRFGTKTLFKNEITREMKVGARPYFRVDLEVPQLPGKTLTLINIHLEIKCLPEGREAQISEILEEIRKIKNPLILLGDFNAAPTDISATSVTRVVKRALGVIGKYRLDWVFVKSGLLNDPLDRDAPYRFAPHFGETLEEMNTSLRQPLSDHHPSLVDLPFEEPRIKNSNN